jgi:A/G-specific adenine glycosylase
MDLGATVCTRTRPACAGCPLARTCVAYREDRVAELPGRRAARASPLRETAMLVLLSQGEVLLQKRPPRGIWGGLWSLPEAPADADPAEWARRSLGFRARDVEALAPFIHAFTHFRLSVRPWLLRAGRANRGVDAPGFAWLDLGEAADAALPAPVKRLLACLPGT